jgi:hypothetical protein
MSGVPTSAEPHWAETTVRWLRSKRPEYVRTSVSEPAVHQLGRALSRMSWQKLDADDSGLTQKEYQDQCDEAARIWVKADHDELVKWLGLGGYAAEKKRRDDAIKEMGANEDDHVALALSPDELAQAVGKLKAPHIEITIAEILADADRHETNPDCGSW